MATSGEGLLKWMGGVGSALSVMAVSAVFFMWNSINTMQAQEPLINQLRAIEMEQIRQGMQLNTTELDVVADEIDDLEKRVDNLEDGDE